MNIDMLSLPATGQCQCSQIQYAVSAQPFVAYTCHCSKCQQLSSSAFITCIQVPSESVSVTSGNAACRERMADSGNQLITWFCSDCGSALFSQNSARPRIRTVYVGTLAQPQDVLVNAHIWLKRKLPWVILPEAHRLYAEAGDWTQDYANDLGRYKP